MMAMLGVAGRLLELETFSGVSGEGHIMQWSTGTGVQEYNSARLEVPEKVNWSMAAVLLFCCSY